MPHCPHIFFDTLRPERPDCPVLIPSNFSVARDRIISQDIYSYKPCGLPTGNFMPQERAQIRLMTASPVTLLVCIPAPDQVTPEQAYFRDLNFYKQTLFHTPFLSRGHAITLLEYRDAQIIFEVDYWSTPCPGQCSATCCPCKPSTSSGTMKLSEISRRITLSGTYVKGKRQTFSATTCSTTHGGSRFGSAQFRVAQHLRLTKKAW